MTKSFQKLSMQPLRGQDYSSTMMEQDPQPELEINETPALDLSCKKSLSSSPASDYGKDPRISPLRGSPYLENHHETNNNDNKHLNPYQLHRAAQQAKEFEHIEHSSAHRYQYDTLSFSSSNHERKSPFESRSYNMTPPSESDSPKKMRFQPIYTPNHSLTEALPHQAFPMHPINLPVPIMSLPVPVPAVMPTLLPQHNGSPPVSQNQMPTSSSPPENAKTTVVSEDSKKPRPFKAYPRDPMSITLGPDMMFDQELKQAYSEFRNRMLDSVKRTNEGTNIKMRRVSKETVLPTSSIDDKDAAYWERRRKNNEAAKRSRDARRAKEDEIAIRAAFLEQEYIRLKYENAMLKEENAKMKCMLYGR